jgi:hypothetical protein
MTKAAEYRSLAAKFRHEAEDATLPHLREINLAAAEKWDALAEELEQTNQLFHRDRPSWIL